MTTGPISLEELRLAYQAAEDGQFRTAAGRPARKGPQEAAGEAWTDSRVDLLVLAAHSAAGASTVALALATLAGSSRIVECCTVGASGLAGAADAELGTTRSGWVQGSRGQVLIERRGDHIASPSQIPHPDSSDKTTTILDVPGDVAMLDSCGGWVADLVRSQPKIVVVARPTVPGLHRLEAAIDVLGVDRVQPVLVGATRRWPKALEQASGPRVRELHAASRILHVPFDPNLARNGLTTEPLSAALLAACSSLSITHLEGTPK